LDLRVLRGEREILGNEYCLTEGRKRMVSGFDLVIGWLVSCLRGGAYYLETEVLGVLRLDWSDLVRIGEGLNENGGFEMMSWKTIGRGQLMIDEKFK
jgi:hypothetical protein